MLLVSSKSSLLTKHKHLPPACFTDTERDSPDSAVSSLWVSYQAEDSGPCTRQWCREKRKAIIGYRPLVDTETEFYPTLNTIVILKLASIVNFLFDTVSLFRCKCQASVFNGDTDITLSFASGHLILLTLLCKRGLKGMREWEEEGL